MITSILRMIDKSLEREQAGSKSRGVNCPYKTGKYCLFSGNETSLECNGHCDRAEVDNLDTRWEVK